MAPTKKVRLGEMLIKAGVIHEFQLNSALSFQRQLGGRLGASLIRLGYLDEETLLQFLSEQYSLTRVDLNNQVIDPKILKLIPVEKALEHSLIPYAVKAVKGAEQLYIATSDPTNVAVLDEVRAISGMVVQTAIAGEDTIIAAIKRCYGLEEGSADKPAVKSTVSTPAPAAQKAAPGSRPLSTEEKLKTLVKILIEKKILSKEDLERFKG